MEHFAITFRPDGGEIKIHAGATLLEAAGQAGIILNSVCGAKGTCGKCLVTLEPDAREVLACQHRVDSDLTVTIPLESRFFQQKILQHGVGAKIEVRPDVYRKYAVGDSTRKILGVAVDIGTTTVVAKLLDMTDGTEIATAAEMNPQTKFGDDVISRITYAQTKENLAELRETIIESINRLIAELCDRADVTAEDIYEACVVANTTMNHIFLSLPITQLGYAPYEPASVDPHDLTPEESLLRINPAGSIHTVANIAGFVGADTVAVALAADIGQAEKMTLAIDIGTNGEVVLGTKERLLAASCAAGPAFEGARITHGGRAADGAIEAVVINGEDIDVDVIGPGPARTICGSGLIDAVAALLDLGIVDSTGRFAEPENLPPAIHARLCRFENHPAFVLADATDRGGAKILLTQKDIRETQLAKAAIRAGIKLLQMDLDIADADIECVYLAGAFGNYINPASAKRIGLLPDVPLERTRSIGNAAVVGAQMALISNASRKSATALARKIQYIEIAHQGEFQNIFADCLMF